MIQIDLTESEAEELAHWLWVFPYSNFVPCSYANGIKGAWETDSIVTSSEVMVVPS